jgi:hypothetical protein
MEALDFDFEALDLVLEALDGAGLDLAAVAVLVRA